jgi:integrase
MPKYKKKITRQMDYNEFKEKIHQLPIARQAFLTVLFFAGVRISEALALTPDNINCTQDTIFVDFFRLKGSKQTDPIPLPKIDALNYLCGLEDDPFPWHRTTGWRIVKRAFPDEDLYPHFFRQNRITKISEQHGDAYVYSYVGITASSIDHYRGKVDIKRVGEALREEIV